MPWDLRVERPSNLGTQLKSLVSAYGWYGEHESGVQLFAKLLLSPTSFCCSVRPIT